MGNEQLTTYEQLENEACEDGIDIIEYEFESSALKGLYIDNTIGLSKQLKTYAEKKCIIAEEMGHHYTSSGNIIDQKEMSNRKQEHRARVWAYRKLIELPKLVKAFEHGCRNRYEIAQFLNVTEDFLEDSLNYFKTRYPNGYRIENYYIQFYPNLQIAQRF